MNIFLQTRSEVISSAFLTMKPQQMSSNDIPLTESLSCAYFRESAVKSSDDERQYCDDPTDSDLQDDGFWQDGKFSGPIDWKPIDLLESTSEIHPAPLLIGGGVFRRSKSEDNLTNIRKNSNDSLEAALKNVNFERTGVVDHPWKSVAIQILGLKGLKFGSESDESVGEFVLMNRSFSDCQFG